MDYEIFSSNNSILQSSAIHPKIATADLISRFEGEGITSAFDILYTDYREFRKTHSNEVDFTYEFTSQAIQTFSHVSEGAYPDPETKK